MRMLSERSRLPTIVLTIFADFSSYTCVYVYVCICIYIYGVDGLFTYSACSQSNDWLFINNSRILLYSRIFAYSNIFTASINSQLPKDTERRWIVRNDSNKLSISVQAGRMKVKVKMIQNRLHCSARTLPEDGSPAASRHAFYQSHSLDKSTP